MEKLLQQKQTKECCAPAVQSVSEQELTIPQADRGLSMSDQTADLDLEVTRLKRELTEARIECHILKRIVAYFAKAPMPETRA